jgi:hypothetical protein
LLTAALAVSSSSASHKRAITAPRYRRGPWRW